MKVRIEPGTINGTITAPPSKSLTQRAFAAALLHRGTSIIHNTGTSADELAALGIIAQLGATVTVSTQPDGLRTVTVVSKGIAPLSAEINCGESGLAARLFTPIAALHHTPLTITGNGTLLRRPLNGITGALEELGVSVSGFSGHIPFTVCGPIIPMSLRVDAGGSSQLISGLLFALSASVTAPVTLKVYNLESTPYIDLTLSVLANFGKPIVNHRYKEFYIDPANFSYRDTVTYTVEADWSSASCLLVGGALGGAITVTNLNRNSMQADSALLSAMESAGVSVTYSENAVTTRTSTINPFDFNATQCPDLFPALAAMAAYCNGECNIRGVHRLFNKESNRIESITEMLWRYGIHFSVEDNILTIEGETKTEHAYIDGYKDHRIVMAATICALRAKGPVTITGAESVNKSYPDFFTHLQQCGLQCTFI